MSKIICTTNASKTSYEMATGTKKAMRVKMDEYQAAHAKAGYNTLVNKQGRRLVMTKAGHQITYNLR